MFLLSTKPDQFWWMWYMLVWINLPEGSVNLSTSSHMTSVSTLPCKTAFTFHDMLQVHSCKFEFLCTVAMLWLFISFNNTCYINNITMWKSTFMRALHASLLKHLTYQFNVCPVCQKVKKWDLILSESVGMCRYHKNTLVFFVLSQCISSN